MSESSTELILFAHGSSVESANEAVRHVASAMAEAAAENVSASFLEGGVPDLPAAIRTAVSRGASRVVVIPYFLTVGLHLKRDLPELVLRSRQEHPNLRIEVTPPLDGHPALVAILLDRARSALDRNDRP